MELRSFIIRLAHRRYGLDLGLCEDIAQDVLVAFWKKFPDQDPSLAWVSRAAHLQCLQKLRTDSRRIRREVEFASRCVSRRIDETSAKDRRLELLVMLERLTGKRVDIQGEFDIAKLADIATKFGIPVGTVYRRIWEERRKRKSPPAAAV